MTGSDKIAAVVLAAGLSSRFPGDKLLHPLAGKPLAAHIADTLLGLPLSHRLAVCQATHPDRDAIFATRGFEIIINPAPERGMASSLALAARRAIALDVDALVVCLADMPNVTAEHLVQLIATARDSPAAATAIDGRPGPPAVFGRALLPELARLAGDRGARELLAQAALFAADADLGRDYDTLADFN